MRCHICDKTLGEAEIQLNKDTKEWEPCVTCLEIALEAAYSDGFSSEDNISVEATESDVFLPPVNETLDVDVFRSTYDGEYAGTSYGASEDEYG